MKVHIDGIIYGIQKTGGISRYFNEYLTQITRIDDSTNIKIALSKKPIGTLPKSKNIHITNLPQLPAIRPMRVFKSLIEPVNKYIKNMYWKNQTKGIFHSTYFTTYKSLGIPQVLTVHDMIYEKFPEFFNRKSDLEFIKQKKKCIDSADSIICVSHSTKKDLMDTYDINENKISVVYLGVSSKFKEIKDRNLIKKLLDKKGIKKPYLLYVGQRYSYKNFLTFIHAHHLLNDVNLNIICVGGGQFNEKECSLFEKFGIKDQVHIFTHASDDELALLYNGASAFVFPSLYEGFGLPILEAMACGSPMTISNISSLPEIAGEAALYFDPKNEIDMMRKIKQTISDGKNSSRVKLGLNRVRNFTWEKTAKETLDIYKKYA